jgi:hypothetical protein
MRELYGKVGEKREEGKDKMAKAGFETLPYG